MERQLQLALLAIAAQLEKNLNLCYILERIESDLPNNPTAP